MGSLQLCGQAGCFIAWLFIWDSWTGSLNSPPLLLVGTDFSFSYLSSLLSNQRCYFLMKVLPRTFPNITFQRQKYFSSICPTHYSYLCFDSYFSALCRWSKSIWTLYEGSGYGTDYADSCGICIYRFTVRTCIWGCSPIQTGRLSHHLKVFYLNNASEDGSACCVSLWAVQTPLERSQRAWARRLQQCLLLSTLLMTLSSRYLCTSLLQISFLLVKVVWNVFRLWNSSPILLLACFFRDLYLAMLWLLLCLILMKWYSTCSSTQLIAAFI